MITKITFLANLYFLDNTAAYSLQLTFLVNDLKLISLLTSLDQAYIMHLFLGHEHFIWFCIIQNVGHL